MATNKTVVHALKVADAHESIRHIFIRDLMLTALIGVYNYEKEASINEIKLTGPAKVSN